MPDGDVVVFRGRQFHVVTRAVPGADGRERVWERVERVPAVAVLAERQGRLVVIRQFRPAVAETLWELPAGRVDAGEDPALAAVRELREETGYRAQRVIPVFRYYPSPGYTTEEIFLYWAPDVEPGQAEPEPDEAIRVVTVTRRRLASLIAAGEIRNGLLLVGALWWLHRRQQPPSDAAE
jgi:ADP-ribose pyrophosphatase